MRLAIFIFICFATSTAVNSAQSNYSGARDDVEQLKAILNAIPRLSPNNSSMTRQLRQVDQPDWCKELKDQPVVEVMANCKELHSVTGYALRIDKNVTVEAWKKFIGSVTSIHTPLQIVGNDALTELKFPKTIQLFIPDLVINGNYNLKTIEIPQEPLKFKIGKLEIRRNENLTTIDVGMVGWNETELIVQDNPCLSKETKDVLKKIEMKTKDIDGTRTGDTEIRVQPAWCQHLEDETIEEILAGCRTLGSYMVPKRYVLRIGKDVTEDAWKKFIDNLESIAKTDVEIIGSSLTEVILAGKELSETKLTISNNPKLETIAIKGNEGSESSSYMDKQGNPAPQSIKIEVDKLEIRQNDKLKTIDLGEQTRWKETELVVQENALLSSETLETLKKIEWKSKDIQGDGGGLTTTTTTTTSAPAKPAAGASSKMITTTRTTTTTSSTTMATSPETTTSGGGAFPIAILPIFLILGF